MLLLFFYSSNRICFFQTIFLYIDSQITKGKIEMHCRFSLFNCEYVGDKQKIGGYGQKSEIALTYTDFEKESNSTQNKHVQYKRIPNQHSQSSNLQINSDGTFHKENEVISTRKKCPSSLASHLPKNQTTKKNMPCQRTSLKKRNQPIKYRNQSSLCELISNIDRNSLSHQQSRISILPFKHNKQNYEKISTQNLRQSSSEMFMSESEFREYYQSEMVSNKKLSHQDLCKIKEIPEESPNEYENIDALSMDLVEKEEAKTKYPMNYPFSFANILRMEEQEPHHQYKEVNSREILSYKQLKKKSSERQSNRRQKQQKEYLHQNEEYISYSTQKPNPFQSILSTGFQYDTLASVSKQVESIREQKSANSLSLQMSNVESLRSNCSSQDGSKLYRTIKKLTSKTISNHL